MICLNDGMMELRNIQPLFCVPKSESKLDQSSLGFLHLRVDVALGKEMCKEQKIRRLERETSSGP